MSLPQRVWNRLRRWRLGEDLLVWYHPSYRLPLASLERSTGIDPRRADLAAWTLLQRGVIDASQLRLLLSGVDFWSAHQEVLYTKVG